MSFGVTTNSSIELCVAEWTAGSRYKMETTVFAESGRAPLLDVEVFRLTPVKRLRSWHLALMIRQQMKLRGYELIITHQHIPTAARIAAFNRGTPVILATHNFIDPPRAGLASALHNSIRYRQLESLAGITLVSYAALRRFESDWPNVTIPRRVITHGSDFSSWHPATTRQKTIVVVGRADETKGILEAAQGITAFLQKFNDWRAVFCLSYPERHRDYHESVLAVLKPFQDQTEVLIGIPFAQVKQITENASISIVASKWEEPFGRTALEAHAGGAVLISSGTGGLREISGKTAVYLDEVTGDAIASALFRLGSDDVLRKKLSQDGMQRARQLFSLTRTSSDAQSDVLPLCERLDQFYAEVVERRAQRNSPMNAGYQQAIL